jgi:hypothetical protein
MSFNEAELQVGQYIDREYANDLGNIDNPAEPDDLINLVPEGVIKENQSLSTKYGEQYSNFRLPMGGATDYEEYTIHIKNPKTTTRYKLGTRDEPKHFGGGDELFHLRTTLRTDENGKKVLFVEEIQSDLHSTARSTQSNATYELPPKEKQKIMQQLEEFGITQNNLGDFIYIDKSGNSNFIDSRNLPYLSRYITEGRTENFGSKNSNDFVENFGFEKTKEIGEIVEKLNQGNLPDFPYKKDWVDMAVKEAMKIGAEKGADRVAFTNAATQINRNNKTLNYVQDKIIKKMPKREDLINLPEYESRYQENLEKRYKDQFLDVPTEEMPTMEEYYASLPAEQKKIVDLKIDVNKLEKEMQQRLVKDLDKFKQQYPELTKDTLPGYKDARGIEGFYGALAVEEMNILTKRANDAFDITSDPRNVDVTNPALARMLDADLNFRVMPTEITEKLAKIKSMQEEIDRLEEFAYMDEKFLQGFTIDQLARELRIDEAKYVMQDVGYKLEGDEILNPQRTKMVGDDYDEQRINFRRLTNDEELLAEIPEKFRDRVRKDLAAGKTEITLNIDDLEGSGKKFLEIYKNEIPRGINKVLKDLKVKDVKPDISNVLYSTFDNYDPNQLFTDFKYLKRVNEFELDEFYDNLYREPYQAPVTSGREPRGQGLMLHKSIGIDLTDDMKKKILQEGLPSMYMGGKVTKSKFMDRPIEGNRREM